MVNKSMVVDRLAFIEDALKEMRALCLKEKENFLEDKTSVAAVESYLRRSLEALFDIGRHILVHEGWHDYSMEYKSIANGIVEKRVVSKTATQQSVHLTGGILRGFQAFFKPRKNPAPKQNLRPPTRK